MDKQYEFSSSESKLDRKEEHFFQEGFEKAHTVVFFLDSSRGRIGMLKRDPTVTFAGGKYTGIGGKIEPGEGHISGAVRELNEELLFKEKPYTKEQLSEFARVIINETNILSYFVLSYSEDTLPTPTKGIGQLDWFSLEKVLESNLPIIPTTKYFMEVWRKRNWNTNAPFTVRLTRKETNDVSSPVTRLDVEEGLRKKKS